MSTELSVKEHNAIAPVTKQMVDDFLFSQEIKLTETQKTMFYNLAMQFSLNPFKREIYAIKYGQGFNYVTGYQVYVSRAEATGLLNGWHVEPTADTKGQLSGAQITIFRKDWDQPFVWVVSLAEFRKDQNNWKTMPEFMIKKVAIGQGFRLAFPNELGGMPYLQEELEGVTPHGNGHDAKPPVTTPQSKSAAAPAGDTLEVHGAFVAQVSKKEGKSGKGPWTLYGVNDGQQWYNTFDTKLGQIAEAAKESGDTVDISYTVNDKGKFDLVGITVRGADAKAPDEVLPPEEDQDGDPFK